MHDTLNTDDVAVDASGLVASSLGWPYWYGKGNPGTSWSSGASGVDCSGYVQMCLVQMGILPSTAPDRGARTLADICDPLGVGQEQPGDIAIYPGHVMLVVGYPGPDGHAPVCGASGGTSETFGADPNARVKLFTTGAYRGDFCCYGRLKPEYRA